MVCLFVVGVSAKSSLITNLAGVVLASLYPPFVYAFTSSALIRIGKPLSFHSVHFGFIGFFLWEVYMYRIEIARIDNSVLNESAPPRIYIASIFLLAQLLLLIVSSLEWKVFLSQAERDLPKYFRLQFILSGIFISLIMLFLFQLE
jgi:uncharacterized protein with PQ loop repeat